MQSHRQTLRQLIPLIAAVYHAAKVRLADRPVYQQNGGNPMWWPMVAKVVSHIAGYEIGRKQAADLYRKNIRDLSQAAKDAMIASVEPDVYRDTLKHVLESGEAPAGAPPLVPGLNVEPPVHENAKPQKAEPEWATREQPDISTEVEAAKLRLRAKYYEKGYRQMVEDAASWDQLLDAVGEAVHAIDPVLPADLSPPAVVLWNRPRVLMPLLSDMHVGEQVDPNRIKGFNEYNFAVLDERLDRWCTVIEEQYQYQRALGPVEEICLPMIGDMVTGENIYKGQWMHIEETAVHQIFVGADKLSEALMRLARLGPRIRIKGVGGNHARMGRKGESDFSNDFLLYKYLEAKLQNQPNIMWELDWAFWTTARHWDWRFYFCHGDNIRGWGGYPWYGQARADANTLMLMLTQGNWYHFFIHGHFHTDMSLQTPIGKRMANGNWIGTTEYGINGGFGGRPSQKLLVITEKGGIESEMTIYLDEITADFMNQTVAGHGLGWSAKPS